MRYLLASLLFFVFGLFFPVMGFSQTRQADLEIVINQPSDNSVFQWGDTAKFSFYIQNNGPDTLMPDDMTSVGFLHFGQIVPLTGVKLDPGDTMQFNNAATLWNDNPAADDTGQFCMSIHIVSSNIVDTNTDNDTSCVRYILKGNNNAGLSGLSNNHGLIDIFPNPVSGKLSIRFRNPPQQCSLSIVDILGKVRQYYPKVKNRNNVFDIDVSNLKSGIYMLEINTDKEMYRQKIVVR